MVSGLCFGIATYQNTMCFCQYFLFLSFAFPDIVSASLLFEQEDWCFGIDQGVDTFLGLNFMDKKMISISEGSLKPILALVFMVFLLWFCFYLVMVLMLLNEGLWIFKRSRLLVCFINEACVMDSDTGLGWSRKEKLYNGIKGVVPNRPPRVP